MPQNRRRFLQIALAATAAGPVGCKSPRPMHADTPADIILFNGRITTLNPAEPEVANLAIRDGRFLLLNEAEEYADLIGPRTVQIDLRGRRVIPGLNDSHLHLIRAGLNYNLELRWDGVPSLADALRMLKQQVQRTPPGQWVRVVGSFSEFQFAERRLPTLDELNEAAPDTPVFVLHLYCQALLNRAALRAVGYTRDTPNPPGAEIQRDKAGHPTGLLIARPNAGILYATLAKGPRLPAEHQANSSRHFMREMNRLGLTSCIDAGGGYQNYPDDYAVFTELHRRGDVTVRTSYNLFTQKPKGEKDDFARWMRMTRPGEGDDFARVNGAGEMLVFSAADFEDFMEPRPDLAATLETELEEVVRMLASNGWPFRLHATYDESITRFLDVFERVHRDVPIDRLHWFLDHCETITDRNIGRLKAMGGGIAVQHRMAFQGEYFVERYGARAAERTPPIRRMLELGVPVGAGTDATRVANYNPWNSLYWLVTGRTLGGLSLYPEKNLLTRDEALRLYTRGSAWMSREEDKKGVIAPGQLADLAVLSDDYFSVPAERIKSIESVLTVVGGRVVYASGEFSAHAPPPVPVMPEWSPVAHYGGYGAPKFYSQSHAIHGAGCECAGDRLANAFAGIIEPAKAAVRKVRRGRAVVQPWGAGGFWGAGCDCWAF
jgi:predicted amidohydrolase YtcJ